ncbi:DMT family transporter [Accumulibacter sp.]|uniref:DMT family transporter n=1 Tax=Accumulibacter sp. TaxID=2053492 RepID=UPI0025D36AFA|nr:DMT family transporter [Accumulibacter sp.]MCM8594105.1 DMT family transporter [Accumulibacter sp.]MCM8625374.1 DMT family transporter [Accumulibacter sp.]MDS4048248.1 DMT family transporter [Accumulibacter sp.]
MQSFWMLLASLCFACMGVCVKLAALTHSAGEIVFYRSVVSLILVFVLVRVRGVTLATAQWRWQISRGILGFAALFTYFSAITLLPLATAVTLNYTSAIFLGIYLAISGRRLQAGGFGSLVVGLAGVALLLRPTLGPDQIVGVALGLTSGALAGMAYFSVRELGARGEPETRTVFYFSLVSSAGAGPWLLGSEIHAIDPRSAALLFGVAGFATAAQLAMTRAYAAGSTLLSAALAYSTVIFASAFERILWSEAHGASSWLGMALIVASGVAATRYSLVERTRGEHGPRGTLSNASQRDGKRRARYVS